MNFVSEQRIKDILNQSEIEVKTIFDKCTIVVVKLPNGFVLTESSGAVDITNYSEEIGKQVCMKKIEDQLWKLEGYLLASKI